MSISNYENHFQLIDGLIEALKLAKLHYPVECDKCGGKGEAMLTPQEGEWDYIDFRISKLATYGPCQACDGKGYRLINDT